MASDLINNSIQLPGNLTITDPDVIMCLSGYEPPKSERKQWQGREVHTLLPMPLPNNTDEEAEIGLASNVTLLARRLQYWQRNFEFITNDKVIAKLENDVKVINKRLGKDPGRKDKLLYLKGAEQLEHIFQALINSDASREKVTALGKGLHALYKTLWVDVMLDDNDMIELTKLVTAAESSEQKKGISGIKEGLKGQINAAIDAIIHARLEAGQAVSEVELMSITSGLAGKLKAAQTVQEVDLIKECIVSSIQAVAQIKAILKDALAQEVSAELLNAMTAQALSSIYACQTPTAIFSVVTELKAGIQEALNPAKPPIPKVLHDSRGWLADAFAVQPSLTTLPAVAVEEPGPDWALKPTSLINMSWLLDMPLTEDQIASVLEYAEQLYTKAQSQERLSTAEWRNLAKAWSLNSFDELYDEKVEELVLKYALTHREQCLHANGSLVSLPKEFMQLIEKKKLKDSILDSLRYIARVDLPLDTDPNGNAKLLALRSNIQATTKSLRSIKKTQVADLPSAIKQLKLLKIKSIEEDLSRSEIDKALRLQRESLENFCYAFATALAWKDVVNIEEHWEVLLQLIEKIKQTAAFASESVGSEALKALQVFEDLIFYYHMRLEMEAVPDSQQIYTELLLKRLYNEQATFTPTEARKIFEQGILLLKEVDPVTKKDLLAKCYELSKKLLRQAEVANQKTSPTAKAAHLFQEKYKQFEMRNLAKQQPLPLGYKTTIPSVGTIITDPRAILSQQKMFYDMMLAPAVSFTSAPLVSLNSDFSIPWTPPATQDAAKASQLALEASLNQALIKAIGCQAGDVSLKLIAEIVRGRHPATPLSTKFGNAFNDQGLALLSNYVYPYILCEHRLTAASQEQSTAIQPASAQVLAALVPDTKEQVRLLIGLIQGMDSVLNGGAVRADSQVKMLQKCFEAVNGNKTVMITAKPGSGKSTMVRLFGTAFPVANANLSAIIHVAPFVQSDPSWIPLKTWADLTSANKGPAHFAITALDLEKLLAQAMPNSVKALLNNALFVNDEYDHPDYRLLLTRLSDLGCKRHVNISATGSALQMENRIKHWQVKIAGLQAWLNGIPAEQRSLRSPEVSEIQKRIAKYANNAQEMEIYKKSLKAKMEAEFNDRAIEICEANLSEEKTLGSVLAEIIQQPGSETGSYLVEMPYQTEIKGDLLKSLVGKPSSAITLLCREVLSAGVGLLRAYVWSVASQTWQEMPFEQYKTAHDTMKIKPKVICIYGKDSTGGDFEKFSRIKTLEKDASGVGKLNTQYLLFANEIVGFQQAYQNLSRLRRSGEDVSALPPVKIYLGKELFKRIQANDQKQMKSGFLLLAQSKASKEELQAEEMRLKDKVKRKTMASLELMLQQRSDIWIETLAKTAGLDMTHSWILKIAHELKSIIKDKREQLAQVITAESDLEKLSKQLSSEVLSAYVPPNTFLSPKLQKDVQVAQGLIRLSSQYFGPEKNFQSCLNDLAAAIMQQGASLPFAAVWPKFLAEKVLNTDIQDEVAVSILRCMRTPLGDQEREKLGNRKLRESVVSQEMLKSSPGKIGLLRIITAWDSPLMATSLAGLKPEKLEQYQALMLQAQADKKLRAALQQLKKGVISESEQNNLKTWQTQAAITDLRARINSYSENLFEVQASMQPIQIHAFPKPTSTRRTERVRK